MQCSNDNNRFLVLFTDEYRFIVKIITCINNMVE